MNIFNLVSEAIKAPIYLLTLRKIKAKGIRFVIIGSYALRNIRPVHDLDIDVHEDDWHKVLTLGLGRADKAPSGSDRYLIRLQNGFEIELFHEAYPTKEFSYEKMAKEGFDKDEYGYQCWTIEQTIRWKKAMGRPKDKKDIELLKGLK